MVPQLKKLETESKSSYKLFTTDYVKFNTHDPVLAGEIASDMRAYINALVRLRKAFELLLLPKRVRIERHQNPNLYDLAAKYYKDASKWHVIAEASGLSTPMPIGIKYVKIPFEDLAPNVGGTVRAG